MASWLERINRVFIPSRSPVEMEKYYGESFRDGEGKAISNATHILNPDLSAVTGFDRKYWIVTGDVITLMDQAARDTVDAAEESVRFDSIADELDRTETIMRAFAEAVLDEINILRGQHNLNLRTLAQLKTAVRGKL